jgi:hypothetical protein
MCKKKKKVPGARYCEYDHIRLLTLFLIVKVDQIFRDKIVHDELGG